jgi:hypothetical protein
LEFPLEILQAIDEGDVVFGSEGSQVADDIPQIWIASIAHKQHPRGIEDGRPPQG